MQGALQVLCFTFTLGPISVFASSVGA